MGVSDKLLFTWKDFKIFVNDLHEYTLYYQGERVSGRAFKAEDKPYSADWIGGIIFQVTDEAEGVDEFDLELLVTLAEDLTSDPDLLTWWACSGCGRQTFLVPDDDAVCVWCGKEENGNQTIS